MFDRMNIPRRLGASFVLLNVVAAAVMIAQSWVVEVFALVSEDEWAHITTSSRTAGVWMHRLGLMEIPEESAPPKVLVRAAELRRAAAEAHPHG